MSARILGYACSAPPHEAYVLIATEDGVRDISRVPKFRATPLVAQADYDRVRVLLDEARVIIDTAHQAESKHPGTVRDWHERRREWLLRCGEVGT